MMPKKEWREIGADELRDELRVEFVEEVEIESDDSAIVLSLDDGRRVRISATLIDVPGMLRYEVEVRVPGTPLPRDPREASDARD